MSKANEAAGGRNIKVERAVSAVLERIDDFIAGHELQPLEASLREACDQRMFQQQKPQLGRKDPL